MKLPRGQMLLQMHDSLRDPLADGVARARALSPEEDDLSLQTVEYWLAQRPGMTLEEAVTLMINLLAVFSWMNEHMVFCTLNAMLQATFGERYEPPQETLN